MANNFDASLVNQILAQKAITAVQNKLAWFKEFSTDFSEEVRDKRSLTVTVPVAIATDSVQVNPTNFETGGTTLSACPVTMQHISKSFTLSPYDIASGGRLENLAGINMGAVVNKLESLVFTLITETNYGSVTNSLSAITPGSLSVANLKTLWGSLPGDRKIAILKSTEFQNILPSDLNSFDVTKTRSGYGYDIIDHTNAGFASAGTKLVGFVANPSAIAFASAIPEYVPQVAALLDSTVSEVPELGGLAIQTNIWGSTGTRNVWASYDILFGASAADKTALKLIKTS